MCVCVFVCACMRVCDRECVCMFTGFESNDLNVGGRCLLHNKVRTFYIYTGVQKSIKALQPKATYVHCAAHNLNLVINDAVCAVRESASFVTVLQDVYTFF